MPEPDPQPESQGLRLNEHNLYQDADIPDTNRKDKQHETNTPQPQPGVSQFLFEDIGRKYFLSAPGNCLPEILSHFCFIFDRLNTPDINKKGDKFPLGVS